MSEPARRIGIFGGTFDPVHNGHLIIADALHERAGLDKVLFVPSARPPHKGSEIRFSAEERLHMLMLAIDGDPRFSVSDIELRREGPSYTIDTIREIKRSLGGGTEVLFIVGMDNLYEIGMWKNPKGIVDECRILAARRVCDIDGKVPEWLMRRVIVVGRRPARRNIIVGYQKAPSRGSEHQVPCARSSSKGDRVVSNGLEVTATLVFLSKNTSMPASV